MLFWIIAALIALAIAAMLAAPLLRGRGAVAGAEDLEIYRDQLAEVDRDLARAVLAPEEAERARTEIARRLLSADRTARAEGAEAPRRATRLAAVGVAVAIVGGALLLYRDLGAPGYPDAPRDGRIAAAEARLANLPPQAAAEATVADRIAGAVVTPPDNIAATVDQLRATVAANPQALGELALLRDYEAGVRNFPEAARLSGRLNAALGFDLQVEDLLVELDLLALATNGVMSAEAAGVLEQAVAMAPDHPGVLFFRGLLMQGIGRPDLAFDLWRPLAESGEGSVWRDRARQMIAAVAWEAGVDYAPPPETARPAPPAGPAPAGPDAAAIAAAEGMDPEARAEFIRSMVAGLADRLATQGGPAEDWAQLIRALGVLGETDRARAIWAEAQEVFAGQEGLDTIRAAAAEAGVAG